MTDAPYKLPVELSVAQGEITTLRARVAELAKQIASLSNRADDAESDRDQRRDIAIEMEARADAAEAELARLRQGVQVKRVRHIKRGSTYQEVGRGQIQTGRLLSDYADVVIYQSEEDATFWVRPTEEFDDITRFEKIAALVSPGDGWTPPPEDQRPEGYRCLAMVEMVWEREFTGGMGWHRPDDQMMYRIEEGVPGTHGFLPLPAPPASEGGADHG